VRPPKQPPAGQHGSVLGPRPAGCCDGLEEAAVVEPVHPFEGGELDSLHVAPRAASADHLGLEQADDALRERVVTGIADAADGGLDTGLAQALCASNRNLLAAPVAVVNEAALGMIAREERRGRQAGADVAAVTKPRRPAKFFSPAGPATRSRGYMSHHPPDTRSNSLLVAAVGSSSGRSPGSQRHRSAPATGQDA
jgi:hypothetical protein